MLYDKFCFEMNLTVLKQFQKSRFILQDGFRFFGCFESGKLMSGKYLDDN